GVSFTLYDVFGKRIKQIDHIKSQQIVIQRGNLSSGVYFFKITDNSSILSTGKLIVY
ncbi:MAG: T9SS type A sorting domain-containing protein, partial [Bacteroidetes bacterium]|nr:T9SS type A sorting domain-containing protein [Bacteroidota bacterium]